MKLTQSLPIITMLLVACLAGSALAQVASSTRRMYDSNTETTVKGTVEKVTEICRFDAARFDDPGNGFSNKTFRVDPIACDGCGVCAWYCPEGAIEFLRAENGELFISETALVRWSTPNSVLPRRTQASL